MSSDLTHYQSRIEMRHENLLKYLEKLLDCSRAIIHEIESEQANGSLENYSEPFLIAYDNLRRAIKKFKSLEL